MCCMVKKWIFPLLIGVCLINTSMAQENPILLFPKGAPGETIKLIENRIKNSKTVFVNGPAGAFELSNYAYGTKEIFEILKNMDSIVVIGGGDSASAAIKFGYKNAFTHISTGGGASLEYIEGRKLPGIECLSE